MKQQIDHVATLKTNLTALAKDFGYNLEVDGYDNVDHNGYTTSDVRGMGLYMPKGMDDLEKLFPSAVAMALEDGERDAYAEAMRKARLDAFEEALLKIDLSGGGAEYQDMDGNMISAKAGIISVSFDVPEDTVTLEILNPEHLINAIASGVGMFGAELSSNENESSSELLSRLHNLKDYFEVWGERKPDGHLSSQFSPSVADEVFEEHIKYRLEEISLEEVADCVKDVVDSSLMDAKQAMEMATTHTSYKTQEIKDVLLGKIKDQVDFWNKTV